MKQVKSIVVRNRPGAALPELVIALKNAFDEGWVIPNNFEANGTCMVLGDGWYQVELVRESKEVAPSLNNVEEVLPLVGNVSGDVMSELEELSKKDELLTFATKYNITIPQDVKYPAAIKSHLEKAVKGSI